MGGLVVRYINSEMLKCIKYIQMQKPQIGDRNEVYLILYTTV